MALATFNKICVDALDPVGLGEFWAAALDLRLARHTNGEAGLVDADDCYRVWFNRVPQAKSVKHRVHLDIYTRALADLESLGARVVLPESDDRHWTVMADPEGGEFCAFLREELPARLLHGLVVDSADPFSQARWWHGVLGGRLIEEDAGFATVTDVSELPDMTMDFVPVPEPKSGANRIHWDVAVDSIASLLEAGATVVRRKGDDIAWHVLADPEGNEFCAFDD
jgi:glyoxalase superfamily protein